MRIDPDRNFRYRVEIDGITQAGFAEVEMPESLIHIIDYREGTDPTYARKLSGQTEHGNLILKWGITENKEMSDWWRAVVETGAAHNRKNIAIILMDEQGNDKMRWEIENAWPVRYSMSKLNASLDEVVMEIMEITFEDVHRVS